MLKKNFKNRKYIYAFNSLEIKHESLWFLLNIIQLYVDIVLFNIMESLS